LSEPLVDRVNFARIVTVLAVTFGISAGLCGLTAVLSSQARGSGSALIFIGALELIVMALSALGLVLTVIAWVVASIAGGGGSGKHDGPQKLFENSDVTKSSDQDDQQ
jgi:O-antigen ligase